MFFLHILILYHLLEEVIFTLYYLYTTTKKLSSIKKLYKSYWYVIIFIGLTAFIILRYHSKAQIFFAFIGLLIGIILSIIAMQYSLKRHCKKIDDHSHSSSL